MGRYRGWAVACVLALLAPEGRAADYRFADDVTPAPLEAVVEGPAETASDGLRYLVVADGLDLTAERPAGWRRVAYDVVRESALAEAGRFNIHYQPAYQDVVLHAVDVWRDGRRIDRRADSRIEVLRRESGLESGLLDGRRTLTVTIPDIRVGDRVEYRFTVHGYNPVFGEGRHDYWIARYGVPVALREVRIVHPRAMPLRVYADVPGLERSESDDGAVRSVVLRGRGLPAAEDEDSTPAGYEPGGYIEASTAAGWGDVVRWALPLYPGRFQDRAVAAALAAQLQLDRTDPEGSLLRAVAFVQGEVRYTGLDMGLNSHAPNPPELVAQRRFGDCKDKTQLLLALLREAGIRAEPVLVHTRQRARLAEAAPTPMAFDHVIARAYLPQGEVWIDATRDREQGPLAARAPLGLRLGLPVTAGSAGLVEIPYPFPQRPEVEVEQSLRFSGSHQQGAADFEVVTLYAPGQAEDIRERFESRGAGKVGEDYLAYMRGFYEGLDGQGEPRIEAEGNGARVSERYRLEWTGEDGFDGFGIIPFQLLDWVPRLPDRTRRTPLALAGPRFARHTVRSEHPHGWDIEADHQRVENPWFRFDRDISVDGRELVVVAEWRRLADEVPAEGYAQARTDLLKVRELLGYSVVLESEDGPSAIRAADFAWPAASLGLAAVLLPLLWWRRREWAWAGMMYRPHSTAALRVASGGLGVGIAIGVVVLGLELVFDTVDMFSSRPAALALGGVLGRAVILALRWLFLAWLLRVVLAALGHDGEPAAMRRAFGLSLAPMGVCLLLAMVALGFRFDLLDGGDFAPGQLPSLLVFLLLMLAGLVWWLLSLAGAGAAVARAPYRRGLLAVTLGVLPLVVVALVLVYALLPG